MALAQEVTWAHIKATSGLVEVAQQVRDLPHQELDLRTPYWDQSVTIDCEWFLQLFGLEGTLPLDRIWSRTVAFYPAPPRTTPIKTQIKTAITTAISRVLLGTAFLFSGQIICVIAIKI